VSDSGVYLQKVREKSEKDEFSQHDNNQNTPNKKNKDSKENDSSFKKQINLKTIEGELKQFTEDQQIQNADIHTSINGSGPGLRVVLKDGKGAVIRQFTGEEFIELRKIADREDKKNGKILDIKL